jgi:hypothetical protein
MHKNQQDKPLGRSPVVTSAACVSATHPEVGCARWKRKWIREDASSVQDLDMHPKSASGRWSERTTLRRKVSLTYALSAYPSRSRICFHHTKTSHQCIILCQSQTRHTMDQTRKCFNALLLCASTPLLSLTHFHAVVDCHKARMSA